MQYPDLCCIKVSNYMDLIGDWFFQRGKYQSYVLVDDCKMTDGQPCNPTCPNTPSEAHLLDAGADTGGY